ncbi:MAG: Hsp70 family protein [Aquiluna sp.]|nr:Hsp70 family protein [Aquiluna sp.]MCF8545614.1 Hsp70 family protein [Aquiluna sp.]
MLWGIDFGTSTSLLSYSSGQAVRTAPLGSATNWIPSIAGLRDDRFIFGEDAENLSDASIIRAVKRRITEGNHDSVSIGVGEQMREASVDEIVLGLLKKLRFLAERNLVSDDVTARFGCPAMWDGPRRQRLLNLAESAGFAIGEDPLVDEPIAACISWVQDEITAGRQVKGNVLVYDMGGGTLDVAVIAVDTVSGLTPKYFVKSSRGIDIAGEKIDEEIAEYFCHQIADEKKTSVENIRQSFAWLKRPAREIKERLSSVDHVSRQLFSLPGFGEVHLSLSGTALASITKPLLNKAWETVTAALRDSRLTHFNEGGWNTGVHFSEIFIKSTDALLQDLDHVVLAGGMAPMKAIQEMFLDYGVSPQKIHIAGGRLGAPNEAISRGLAENLESQQLNLARPAFDLVVEWAKYSTDSDGEVSVDESGEVVIYEAYSPLYSSATSGNIPAFRWDGDPRIPYSSHSSLKVVDRKTGEHIQFRNINDRNESMVLDYASSSLRHINLAPNGNLQVIGQGVPLHQVRVASWPVLNDPSGRKVLVQKKVQHLPYEPMWWE